jgi:hypothetical protein
MKTYKYLLLSFLLFLGASCKSDLEETDKDGFSTTPGVVPESIDQVVDVFELKYGEVKECVYDDQVLKFSVVDIEDKTLPCALIYFGGNPEDFNEVRIHTYLHVETDKKDIRLKVSSTPCSCGGGYYRDDGTDIQHVWDLLESWQSAPAQQMGFQFFKQEIVRNLGDGALIINTSWSIYLGKWYPYRWDFGYSVENSMYKFIFIITTKN